MPRRVRHRDRAHHAQHGRRRRPRRPRGGHVPGQRGGAGRREDAVRGAAGRLHQGAAGGRAVRRTRHGQGGRACGGPSDELDGSAAGRRGQGPRDRLPGSLRSRRVHGGRRRRLRDPARRGARPRRRIRFGQDHHRPRDRRAHQGHRRLAEGAGRRDERHPRTGLPPAPQPHRLRVPGPGVELQPAAHDRGVRRRAAHHPWSGEGCLVGTRAR